MKHIKIIPREHFKNKFQPSILLTALAPGLRKQGKNLFDKDKVQYKQEKEVIKTDDYGERKTGKQSRNRSK